LEGGLLPIISLTSLHFFVKYEKNNSPKKEEVSTKEMEFDTDIQEIEEINSPNLEEVSPNEDIEDENLFQEEVYLPEEKEIPEEIQGEIVFTTTAEYIQGASVALATVSELDPMIMNKADELRVKRIKRKAIKIIDICISEMYDELFETDEDE
jgi:hypothetical protein